MATEPTARHAAVLSGAVAYLIWGFVPLVLQAVGRVGPGAWEILAHRILWGAVTAAIFVAFARQGRGALRVLKEPKTLLLLLVSSALIGANWLVFIWAVNSGHVMQTSLGYYISPLVSMAAGGLIFRERLGRLSIAAIGLAVIGVAVQAAALGQLPFTSLALAATFGGYGIVRKYVSADAQTGLLIECLILAPLCLGYVLWLEAHGAGHFLSGPAAVFWLIASGPATATPLALFAWAARRMPLSALGFMQFLAPTISFAIAVAQGEAFTPLNALAFSFIWLGAAVFVFGVVRTARETAGQSAV
jgi:chloramphenicol-sensitive protein RarD